MKFSFTHRHLTLLIFLLSAQFVVAQSVVKGKIIDGTTGEVLVGATVVIKGTTVGAQSDYDGLFEFKTTQALPMTISISFIGFETKEMELTDAADLQERSDQILTELSRRFASAEPASLETVAHSFAQKRHEFESRNESLPFIQSKALLNIYEDGFLS